MRAFLLLGSAAAVRMQMTEDRQDFGFMGNGEGLPEICGVKELSQTESDWVKAMHEAVGHTGVRVQLKTTFENPLKCWYGQMAYKDQCGGLKPVRTSTPDRRAFQTKCRDPTVSFAALFADPMVKEEERRYLLSHYPNQKDGQGNAIPGSYSEVMNVLYTLGGKEVLCQALELIDDGCKYAGPFKEY